MSAAAIPLREQPAGEARLAEWAGPELLVAAEGVLPLLLRQRGAGGDRELEATISAVELAILKATTPWEDLTKDQQRPFSRPFRRPTWRTFNMPERKRYARPDTLGSFDCAAATRALRSRLLEARKAKGLRQRELGAQLGRPQSFISNYEVGARRLEVAEFVAISQALGLNAAELVSEMAAV